MKRFVLLAMAASCGSAAFGQEIGVVVNGNPVGFRNRGPVMVDDRVLVPLRGVLQALGAEVDWDPRSQTVNAHKPGLDVRLTIGETTASVNGAPAELDVPAQIIGGSTMVPIRFVSEALGEVVKWDTRTETVYIHDSFDNNGQPEPEPQPQPTPPPPPPPPPVETQTLPRGMVLPVHVQDLVSSDVNVQGDHVEAILDRDLPGIPAGSMIEGYVKMVRPHTAWRAGILEIKFDRIVAPDLRYDIRGTGFGLDRRSVIHKDGALFARPDLLNSQTVFAGLDSGSGNAVGLRAWGPPYYPGYRTYGYHPAYRAAILRPKTEFGIRLDEPIDVQTQGGPPPQNEDDRDNGG